MKLISDTQIQYVFYSGFEASQEMEITFNIWNKKQLQHSNKTNN